MTENKEPMPRETSVPSQYSNKLLEFQKEVSTINKDSVNPFFKSKYFDINTVIDTIKPVLNKLGLVITQGFDYTNGQNLIVTKVMDGRECLAVSEMIVPEQPDVQKLGAAITYCRRYSLVSLLLLQGEEDDDGNSATKAPVKQKSAPSATEKPKGDLSATPKQKGLIQVLMREKGIMRLSDIGIDPITNPTMTDASMIIKKLTEHKIGENIIEIDQDYPA